MPIEESGGQEEAVKEGSSDEIIDRTGTANNSGHSNAEPYALGTVAPDVSGAQDIEPTSEVDVANSLIEEPNHDVLIPDYQECATTTMDEISTSSDNLKNPQSEPASQDSYVEEEHAKIPAYSQLPESGQIVSVIERYEDVDGQDTSDDHIPAANSKEDASASQPASSSSSSSSTVRGLYSVHQIVMAADRGVLYEAKVLQSKYVESSWQYFIHFNGWARRHDTWIEEALIGLTSDTERLESIRETMKEEMKRAAAAHADERGRARAARKDSDGDSTALYNNAIDNSNSNNSESNGDGEVSSATTSRKKRSVEFQVRTYSTVQ